MTENREYDPFEESGAPSLSFDKVPVGTTRYIDVTATPSVQQQRDFQTGQPAVWDNGDPKMAVVIVGTDENGDASSIWCPKTGKAGSKYVAIREAQRAAGVKITAGCRVYLTYTGDEPSDNKRFSDRKLWSARIEAPDRFADTGKAGSGSGGGDDLL